jgi:hypothetical protein
VVFYTGLGTILKQVWLGGFTINPLWIIAGGASSNGLYIDTTNTKPISKNVFAVMLRMPYTNENLFQAL